MGLFTSTFFHCKYNCQILGALENIIFYDSLN